MGVLWIAGEARDQEEPGSQSQRFAPQEAMPGLASGVFQGRETDQSFVLGSPETEPPFEMVWFVTLQGQDCSIGHQTKGLSQSGTCR